MLPVSLGLADGILNALTLASASLVGGHGHVTVGLAVRISIAALVTAGFSVFVATYSEARGGLRHAAHQLSLPSENGLVATQLGRNAIRHAIEQCGLASASSMLGALLPLLIAAALPGPAWIAPLIAIAALGVLGIGLATAVMGNQLSGLCASLPQRFSARGPQRVRPRSDGVVASSRPWAFIRTSTGRGCPSSSEQPTVPEGTRGSEGHTPLS